MTVTVGKYSPDVSNYLVRVYEEKYAKSFARIAGWIEKDLQKRAKEIDINDYELSADIRLMARRKD